MVEKKAVFKPVILLILTLAFISSCNPASKDTSSGTDKETKEVPGKKIENPAMMLIGGQAFDASKIMPGKIDKSYKKIISKILNGNEKYSKIYNEFKTKLIELVSDKNSPLYGADEVYVSKLPLFWWDAVDNRVLYYFPNVLFSKCIVFHRRFK